MKRINGVLKFLFFLMVVRPLVLIYIGLNIRNRNRLPKQGPAILIANHNSHLDTMVLMSLFSLRQVGKIRPVAAADYFLKTGLLAWFSREIIGIIPLSRKKREPGEPKQDKLEPISREIGQGNIVIFFPEGTRGEAEKLSDFKRGIGILAERHPQVPIFPIYLYGLGKALPKGETLLVPFFCDVYVGEAHYGKDHESSTFVDQVQQSILGLAQSGNHHDQDEQDDLYF